MKSLRKAVKDYLEAFTIKGSKPYLCWDGGQYFVSLYFSKECIEKHKCEVIK